MLIPVVIVSAVLYFLLSSILDPLQVFLALVLLVMVAFTIQYHRRRDAQSLPFVPVITVIYGLYFAFPALTTVPIYERYTFFSQSTRIEELLLVIAGVGIMLFAYYRLPNTLWQRFRPPLEAVRWSDERATVVGVLLGVVGLAYSVSSTEPSPIASIARQVSFLNSANNIALVILLYLLFTRVLGIRASILLVVLLTVRVGLDLGSGFLAPIFQDLFLIGMVYVSARKRLPWKAVILSFGVVLLLLSGKSSFRTETRFSQTAQADPLKSASVYLSIIQNVVRDPQNAERNNATFTSTVQRLDQGSLFVHVIEYTPAPVPFLYGSTYANLLSKVIPRFIWADKPTENAGQEFGHRYGILDPGNTQTSWNMPQIIEMYLNFGVPGVLLGMLLVGFLYQSFRTVIEHEANGVWGQLSAIVVYSPLLNVESNFSLVFGAAAFRLVLMYAVGRLAFPNHDISVHGPGEIESAKPAKHRWSNFHKSSLYTSTTRRARST